MSLNTSDKPMGAITSYFDEALGLGYEPLPSPHIIQKYVRLECIDRESEAEYILDIWTRDKYYPMIGYRVSLKKDTPNVDKLIARLRTGFWDYYQLQGSEILGFGYRDIKSIAIVVRHLLTQYNPSPIWSSTVQGLDFEHKGGKQFCVELNDIPLTQGGEYVLQVVDFFHGQYLVISATSTR